MFIPNPNPLFIPNNQKKENHFKKKVVFSFFVEQPYGILNNLRP